AGPAGSVAALCLARAGARVLLVDRARFPRDKACGDLVQPRAVKVLDDLGVRLADGGPGGDMLLIGAGGRSRAPPGAQGAIYPATGFVLPRSTFDERLRTEALGAGAEFLNDDVHDVIQQKSGATIELGGGRKLRGSFVIGADGALSRVASRTGLVAARDAL